MGFLSCAMSDPIESKTMKTQCKGPKGLVPMGTNKFEDGEGIHRDWQTKYLFTGRVLSV